MTEPQPTDVSNRAQVDADHPWPGLAAFREPDQDFFFGRKQEAEDLVDRIALNRLTVLFAISGLGKSSLLQAGVFKRLRVRDFLPVYLRLDFEPGAMSASDQILQAIARACTAAEVEVEPPQPEESAWEYLHRRRVEFWNARNHPVIPVVVFDQFEEIFRSRTDEASRAHQHTAIDLIGDLAEGRTPDSLKPRLENEPALVSRFAFSRHEYRVLLSLREDYLAHLEELRPRVPSIGVNRKRLLPLTGDAAASAIVEAGRPKGLVTEDVAYAIVKFVGESRTGATDAVEQLEGLDVAPALLSVVCRALNQERIDSHAPRITLQQLERDKSKILQSFYADAFKDVSPAMRTFVEERFVADDGSRDLVAYRTVTSAPGVSEQDISTLIERRLIQIELREGRRFLELTHDRLTSLVVESREQRREAEREAERRQEAETQQAALKAAEDDLSASRRRTAIVTVLLIAAAVAAVFAGMQWIKADAATRQAEMMMVEAQQAAKRELKARDAQLESLATAASAVKDATTAREEKEKAEAEAKRIIGEANQVKADAQKEALELRSLLDKLTQESAATANEAASRARAAEDRARDADRRAEAAEARLKDVGLLQEQVTNSKAALARADPFMAASVVALQPAYSGPCPAMLSFSGTIATNIKGPVRYRFTRGDGSILSEDSFESRDQVFETRAVQMRVDSANAANNSSIRLDVLSPRPATAASTFKVQCSDAAPAARVQLSQEQLAAIMPRAPAARLTAFLPFIEAAMGEFGITTPLRQAAFLAQIAHETAQLRFVEEIWGPTAIQRRYEPPGPLADNLGNTSPGDGMRYKGRGPFLITGRRNYKQFGDLVGIDLVENPEQAAEPSVMFRVAGAFWRARGLNELADRGEEGLREMTRRINGGFNGLADRERFYEAAKAALLKPGTP